MMRNGKIVRIVRRRRAIATLGLDTIHLHRVKANISFALELTKGIELEKCMGSDEVKWGMEKASPNWDAFVV